MWSGALLVGLAFMAGPVGAGCDHVTSEWPTAGDAARQTLAESFGPRRQGSNDRYDFHRGLDILAPFGSPVRAIAPGVVRFAGDDPDYQPETMQVAHCWDEKPPADILEDCQAPYYTQYSHLSEFHAKTGQSVNPGTLLGSSGLGDSGIGHLHFEVRVGGTSREDAEHPLRFLPYEDTGPPDVTIDAVDFGDPSTVAVSVSVTMRAGELDVVRVEVELYRSDDGTLLSSQSFDYEQWNRLYGELLDDPSIENVVVDPENFNAEAAAKVVHFQFRGLSSPLGRDQVRVVARVTDVRANSAEAVD